MPGGAELELVGYRIHPESTVAQGERVPRWARPVLITRQGRTYSIHSAGPLQADDRVYLFASPSQIEALDSIYAKPADSDTPNVAGDFTLDGAAPLADVARQYSLPAGGDAEKALSLAEFIQRELPDPAVAGDRVPLGSVELVVKSLDANGAIEKVGLVIDPAESRSSGLSKKAYETISGAIDAIRTLMKKRR